MHVSFWQKTGCETTKFLIPFGQICRCRKLREIHVSFWLKTGCETTQVSHSFWTNFHMEKVSSNLSRQPVSNSAFMAGKTRRNHFAYGKRAFV